MASARDLGSKKAPRTKKPNYNHIHKDPLPLKITPLPPLIPHNPISLLHILYAYLFPPKTAYAHPDPPYKGSFSLTTCSVNVTDSTSIQGLWCRGFFGKGNLSRSEPTWLTRTKRRLGVLGENENLTAEEVTERRRIERREFKKERAKKEKERLERVLAEEGKLVLTSSYANGDAGSEAADDPATSSGPNPMAPTQFQARDSVQEPQSGSSTPNRSKSVIDIHDLEHLQLTLVEAFFLSYGLGVLSVINEQDGRQLSNLELLELFRTCSYFPPTQVSNLQPDDPFLIQYAVYHHFRSLGWVVKTGVKFSVDYLLYNRGPAFSHAEFAVVILPSYSHPHWTPDKERKAKERPPWYWLHGISRVCSQVKKTVILCFVEIPPPPRLPPTRGSMEIDITKLLESYKVREVALRRWIPSRNRD